MTKLWIDLPTTCIYLGFAYALLKIFFFLNQELFLLSDHNREILNILKVFFLFSD